MPAKAKTNFETLQVIKPHSSLIKTCHSVVRILFEMILDNTHQSHTLAALRDTLLPNLLSGELRVAEIYELAHSSSGTDG